MEARAYALDAAVMEDEKGDVLDEEDCEIGNHFGSTTGRREAQDFIFTIYIPLLFGLSPSHCEDSAIGEKEWWLPLKI